jgi:TRAP-type C4-dicarboxylate transport system permease small subunit
MPARYKILVLLFSATLIVGTLTLWHSSNDQNAVAEFRSLFSHHMIYELNYSLPSLTNRASLWYGGISLFSVIMILFVLKAVLRNHSRRRRQ